MIRRDYEEKESANTETHLAVDTVARRGYEPNAMEEGFAASDGVRGITSATGGRVKHPERIDASVNEPAAASLENENPGLAD